MRFCKYCGTQISETDSVCSNCGKELSALENIKQPNEPIKSVQKSNKLKTQIIIPVIIVTVIAFSSFGFLALNAAKCDEPGCNNKAVSGSNYCYSHKCDISGCSGKRTWYGNFCIYHQAIYGEDSSDDYNTNQVYSWELEVSDLFVYNGSNYTYAEGSIKNNSDQTVRFVELKGSFKNKLGEVIDIATTYAVGSEGLDPGESCKWKMSVDKDTSISDCTVTVYDYDY